MLLELTIRQFAIIEDLKVTFHQGLNILTGETGAGKSIIIDAIQLIIGGRGSVEFIRNGANKAEIEALFDVSVNHPVYEVLEAFGIEPPEDGILLLKRELLQTGKTICRINGQLVTLSMLKEVGQWLVQLHSQHQHQHLMQQDKQLALLDAYGEKPLQHIKSLFETIYSRYTALKKEAKSLAKNEQEMAQRIDLLTYQIEEITKADLKPGEDEELNNQRLKMKHAEKITNGLQQAYQILSEERGIMDLLSQTVGILEQIASFDSEIAKLHEQLSSAYYQIEDVTMEMNQQFQQIEFDPQQLTEMEERLSLLHHLKRKYGESVDDILEYAATIEEELNMIQHRDEHLQSIQNDLSVTARELTEQAKALTKKRQESAKLLSQAIEKELKDLQMKQTKFQVELTYQEDADGLTMEDGKTYHLTSSGLDKIHFLISPNPGEPLKPLHKIASGGELSRIMLAIQTILANKDRIATIIFDEIDTGVSGRAAQAIAEKLAVVAKDKQVFVITHLPQVASMADHHYLIEKKIKGNVTKTVIHWLDRETRIDEIARMLGGKEVTALTKKHAEEMIEKTIPFKKK